MDMEHWDFGWRLDFGGRLCERILAFDTSYN
jgi:hypothetical protein